MFSKRREGLPEDSGRSGLGGGGPGGLRVSAEGGGCEAQASPSTSHCEKGASAGRATPGDTVEKGRGGGARWAPLGCPPHMPSPPPSGSNTL